ncbi:MAG: PaaI family thioesterase [Micropepsaceae bacterium]
MADYNDKPLPPARSVAPPVGWRAADQFDPFEAYLGPYFERELEGGREFGFIIDDRHTNAQNVAHGGALLTFADAALGYALWDATGKAPCVTVSQQTQFISSAETGDFVTCKPELVRKTREIVFIRGDFMVGARVVFTASAVWRIWPKA